MEWRIYAHRRQKFRSTSTAPRQRKRHIYDLTVHVVMLKTYANKTTF